MPTNKNSYGGRRWHEDDESTLTSVPVGAGRHESVDGNDYYNEEGEELHYESTDYESRGYDDYESVETETHVRTSGLCGGKTMTTTSTQKRAPFSKPGNKYNHASMPDDVSSIASRTSQSSSMTNGSKGVGFNLEAIAASRRAMIAGRKVPSSSQSKKTSRSQLQQEQQKRQQRDLEVRNKLRTIEAKRAAAARQKFDQVEKSNTVAEKSNKYDMERGQGQSRESKVRLPYSSANGARVSSRDDAREYRDNRNGDDEDDGNESAYTNKEHRSPYVFVMLSVISLMLLIGIAALSFVVFGGSGSSPLPILTARQEALHDIITVVSETKALADVTSSQYRAHQWLLYEDPLSLSPTNGIPKERIIQRYALAVFYFATGGGLQSWSINNWMKGDECRDSWIGVGCTEDGVVRVLSLNNQGLSGTLPREIGRLSLLEHLILKNHGELSGQIPSVLGHLSHLRQLGLYNSKFTGTIPHELYLAKMLKFLNLQNNELTGTLSPRIELLDRLETLVLLNNQFEGTIPYGSFAVSSNFRFLGLSNNKFSGTISTMLGILDSLEHLYLDGNSIDGALPPTFDRLTNLKSLNLGYNDLTGTIPPQIGGMTSLEFLSLETNSLGGSLPKEMNSLSKLTNINVAQNSLVGSIPELSRLTSVHNFLLFHNQISGSIPDSLFHLTNLEILFLSSNEISGSIPQVVHKLNEKLRGLYLSDNKLTGEIPSDLCELRHLEALLLDENQLSGTIPACVGDLQSLRQLYVFKNELSGELPRELEELSLLTGLGIEENNFRGSLPTEICTIKQNDDNFDLWADCGGSFPELVCPCCSVCCPSAQCV